MGILMGIQYAAREQAQLSRSALHEQGPRKPHLLAAGWHWCEFVTRVIPSLQSFAVDSLSAPIRALRRRERRLPPMPQSTARASEETR